MRCRTLGYHSREQAIQAAAEYKAGQCTTACAGAMRSLGPNFGPAAVCVMRNSIWSARQFHNLDGAACPQKLILRASWMSRGLFACAVTCPNDCDVTDPFGAANCG